MVAIRLDNLTFFDVKSLIKIHNAIACIRRCSTHLFMTLLCVSVRFCFKAPREHYEFMMEMFINGVRKRYRPVNQPEEEKDAPKSFILRFSCRQEWAEGKPFADIRKSWEGAEKDLLDLSIIYHRIDTFSSIPSKPEQRLRLQSNFLPNIPFASLVLSAIFP